MLKFRWPASRIVCSATTALAGLWLLASPPTASAQTISCAVDNAENIALGLANAQGYTIGTNITAAGVLTIDNQKLPLPANGIICVASIGCAGTGRSLTFARNPSNTPVYLLVEGAVSLPSNNCGIDVSGSGSATRFGIGMDRVGGTGGPGGSDGGSCDFTHSTPKRAGEGIGPGGGKASPNGGGGGGASPVADGGSAFGTNAAIGGLKYSDFDHRLLHGGSGGGCGSNTAQTAYAGGGGGGGVLVLAAGGAVQLGSSATGSSTAYLRARGGFGSNWGGGGGGGVIRVVAPSITNNGTIQVDGSGGSVCAANTSNPGGCGAHGVIKLEVPNVTGTFINNSSPQEAIFYGVQQEIVPNPAQRPTLNISGITGVWNGQGQTVAPAQLIPANHVHTSAGVFLEAPDSPQQVITVALSSNNVPHTAEVTVKMNVLGSAAVTALAQTAGSGSGLLTWTAQLTVPAGLELGTIEAWINNVCTPGSPGCP